MQLPVEADRPRVAASDAGRIDTLLATYATSFHPDKRERTHNLTLASRIIDGVILKPGETFSVNAAVGPRLESRGFEEAPIFIKGKLEPGVGGGVCQVSSTLYNAVLLAGLKVVARSHHSQKVPYVPVGRDATVAYGLRDFKFRNTGSEAIGVVSRIRGGRLIVDIYGAASDKKDVKVYTGPIEWVQPKTDVVSDPATKRGARRVIEHGVRGARVVVYRKFTMPDGTSTTQTVSRDRYQVRNTLIGIGSARKAGGSVEPAGITVDSPEVGLD